MTLAYSVSVIVPSYNRTKFLEAALASALAQTFTDREIIVADDGSGSDTLEFLRAAASRGIRVIELPHCGNPGRVRNAAIAAARGRYVAFLDSDDLWKPDKLERQLAALESTPGARWSFTACDHIDDDGARLEPPRAGEHGRQGWIFGELLRLDITVAMPAVVAEREFVLDIGGFDESLPFGEFQDLCLRLALASPVVAIADPLCSVRTHREHYSADRAAAFASWMKLYEKFSRIAPRVEQRALALRLRALTASRLAAHHAAAGSASVARATVREALPFSWTYPDWWWRSVKTWVKTVVAP
jgi:glycosyltransferase involved in cell wall biosynthesis